MEKYNTFKQEENIFIHTRIIDAPWDLVWELGTTPEHIKEWWGQIEGGKQTLDRLENYIKILESNKS